MGYKRVRLLCWACWRALATTGWQRGNAPILDACGKCGKRGLVWAVWYDDGKLRCLR
jgi:hypothetical protein